MEKQDPGLRAACYEAKSAIEKELGYLRFELSKILASHDANKRQNFFMLQDILLREGIAGVDDDIIKNEFLKTHLGKDAFDYLSDLEKTFIDSVDEYRRNIVVFDMILAGVNRFLDEVTRTKIVISFGDESVEINNKFDLLSFFKSIHMPENIIQNVECAHMYFDELDTIDYEREKVYFQSAVKIFLSKLVEPMIEHNVFVSHMVYDPGSIEFLYKCKRMLLQSTRNKYQDLLNDGSLDEQAKKDIEHIIQKIRLQLSENHAKYEEDLHHAIILQKLVSTLQNLWSLASKSAKKGEPFVFNDQTYSRPEDMLALASQILSTSGFNKAYSYNGVLVSLQDYIHAIRQSVI